MEPEVAAASLERDTSLKIYFLSIWGLFTESNSALRATSDGRQYTIVTEFSIQHFAFA